MIRLRYRAKAALLWMVLTAAAPSAWAQDKDADAERLFREGQKLMEERRFGEACPKLEGAYKKDQQLGTLLNLAYCHKEQGATWQAWLEFREAELKAIEAKRTDRRDFARQRMAELEHSLSRAAVDIPPKLEMTEVLVEDRPVPDAENGSPFAIEPGQRKFTFRAKGKKPATAMVAITKGDRTQRVTVPEMTDAPKETEPAPVATAVPAPSKPREIMPAPPPSFSRPPSSQRTVALVVGGVGAAGVLVGSIFGLMTFGSGCSHEPPGANTCPPDERESASSKGAVSTAAFGVGLVALVAGVALWMTAPQTSSTSTSAYRAAF